MKAGEPVSLFDYARAIKEEKKQAPQKQEKKPSILKQLDDYKKQAAQQQNKQRAKEKNNDLEVWAMYNPFTTPEENLIAIYYDPIRAQTIDNILEAYPYIESEDMRSLADTAMEKLKAMSDTAYSELEFMLIEE